MTVFCPFPSFYAHLNVMDYGTHADGATNDSDHITTAMEAAVAAGKRLWFPPGEYYLNTAVWVPSHCDFYGAGDTSHIYRTETGEGLFHFVAGAHDTVMRGFRLGSVMADDGNNSCLNISTPTSNLKFYDLTWHDGYYGANIHYQSAGVNTGLVFDNILAESTIHTAFMLASTEQSTFTNLDLSQSETAIEYKQHQVYIATNCNNLTFDEIICRGGRSYQLHVYYGSASNSGYITFSNVTLIDPADAMVVQENTAGPVTFIHVTGSSTRFLNDLAWLVLYPNATNVTLEDFAITGDPGHSDYLCLSSGAGSGNLLKDGTMTNSARTTALVVSGTAPTYTNVSETT